MPEGDTVFLTAHRLRDALAGKELTHADLHHPKLSTLDLAGRTVTEVVSVGKHLFLRFDDDRSLHSHLRMDGSWHLYRPGQRWRQPGHQARAVLSTADRTAVGFRLHDMALLPTGRESDLVGHLGPDLLDPAWSDRHVRETLHRLRTRDDELGTALLDQRAVAGIGNIYRAETCFLAQVDPRTPVPELPDEALLRVLRIARKLLVREQIPRAGQNTTGDRGRGRDHWVYGRGGQPCLRCGSTVRSAELGIGTHARPVWFCPRCQRHPRGSDIG